jgi:citrate synthase
VIAAHTRLIAGMQPIAPRTDLSLAGNFLYMVFGKEPDPIAAKALDTYWVTVIDHGMNASTFTARVIASTRSDMVSAVTGAIGALKGPLHGGAPGPVLDMLLEIKSAANAEPWVRNELTAGGASWDSGTASTRCATRAPRCSAVAEEMGGAVLARQALFDLAREVERTVLRVLDDVKPGRNLKTNVEFYTALVLQSLGLKPASFVALFACGRVRRLGRARDRAARRGSPDPPDERVRGPARAHHQPLRRAPKIAGVATQPRACPGVQVSLRPRI